MPKCSCGFDAENQTGLAAHQRHCDDADESVEESPISATTVSTVVAEDVFERDDKQCVRCESTDSLTIHRYDEDEPDIPQNLVTLCAECEDVIEGSHPLTKRSQVVYE